LEVGSWALGVCELDLVKTVVLEKILTEANEILAIFTSIGKSLKR
jgi:hypothetical protein